MQAILADAFYVPKVWVDQNPAVLQSFTYKFEQVVNFGYDNFDENPVLEEFVRTYRPAGEYVAFSRGDLQKILTLFPDFQIDDRRSAVPLGLDLQFTGKLKDDQKVGLKAFINPNLGGIFQAAPGYGKTVIMTAYVALQQYQVLLLVNKVDLKDQFISRLRSFTNINELEELHGKPLVGELKFDKKGEPIYFPITVSTYQLVNHSFGERIKKIQNLFGLVMVDECHRAPAASLTKILRYMNPVLFVGVSATPKRADGYHRLLPDILGPVRFASQVKNNCEVVLVQGEYFPFPKNSTMNFGQVLSVVVKSESRNKKIVQNVISDLRDGRRVLVLTDRVAHAENLTKMLREAGISAECVTGPMKVKDRDAIIARITGVETAIGYLRSSLGAADSIDWHRVINWQDLLGVLETLKPNATIRAEINKIYSSKVDCLVATKQLFSEGTDIPCIDTLHLTCPTANEVYLEQAIGRVQREYPRKKSPVARYYCDGGHGVLWGCAKVVSRICGQVLGYKVLDSTGKTVTEDRMEDAL